MGGKNYLKPKVSITLRELGHLYTSTWPNHREVKVKGHGLIPQRQKVRMTQPQILQIQSKPSSIIHKVPGWSIIQPLEAKIKCIEERNSFVIIVRSHCVWVSTTLSAIINGELSSGALTIDSLDNRRDSGVLLGSKVISNSRGTGTVLIWNALVITVSDRVPAWERQKEEACLMHGRVCPAQWWLSLH